MYHAGYLGGQKRALDPVELRYTDGCELPCECWELNQVLSKGNKCFKLLSLSQPQESMHI